VPPASIPARSGSPGTWSGPAVHGHAPAPRLEGARRATAAAARRTRRAAPRARGGGAFVTPRLLGRNRPRNHQQRHRRGGPRRRAGRSGRASCPALSPLEVPQTVAPGEVVAAPPAPVVPLSPLARRGARGRLRSSWGASPDSVVGHYARERGGQVPGRLVSSAKSWLSHPGVDRRSQLLPPGADPEVPRVSPVEASARILRAPCALPGMRCTSPRGCGSPTRP